MSNFFLKSLIVFNILSLLGCEAQKPIALNIIGASRGNTGFRGRIPDEDRDKPMTGNTFVEINLTADKDCLIDSIFVTLKNPAVCLREVSQIYPKQMKANETLALRIENINGTAADWRSDVPDTCEGFLEYYVEKKKYQISIKSFKPILPK